VVCVNLFGRKSSLGEKGGDGGAWCFLKQPRHRGTVGGGGWPTVAGGARCRGDRGPAVTQGDGMASVRQGTQSG
jgi:hypothetical protein